MMQILRFYKGYIEGRQKVMRYDRKCQKDILQEHIRIYEALAEKNPEKAKKAMSDHLDRSKRRAEIIYHLETVRNDEQVIKKSERETDVFASGNIM